MKTVNGNNKLERQITKAKKYMNITLAESSNKYLKIKDFGPNTFIIVNNVNLAKNGELTVIKPMNSNEVFFKSTWATLSINNFKTNYNTLTIFTETNPDKLAKLNALADGHDDIYRLEDFIKVNGSIEIEKN